MAKPRLILRDLRHPRLAEGCYELNRSPIRIGRGPRCEIRLHSDRIADVQVILRQEGDRWTLHPVGPTEGCEIHDGFLVESARLDHGIPFRIGHVEMRLSLDQPAAPVPATEPPVATPSPPPAVIETVTPPAAAVVERPLPPPADPPIAPGHPEPVEPLAVAAPRSASPLSTATDLFPDHSAGSGLSQVAKRPLNLKLGPLPSSAISAASKTLGSIAGGEIAATSAASHPRVAGIVSSMIIKAAPAPELNLEIPGPAARLTGTRPLEPRPASGGFEPPGFPAGSRALPLRRFVRDHDSSSLTDGRLTGPATKDLSTALLFPNPERAATENPPAAARPADKPVIVPFVERSSIVMGHTPAFAASEAAEVAAEPAALEDRPLQVRDAVDEAQDSIGIESSVAEFESWLDSVGPIMDVFDPFSEASAADEAGEQGPIVESTGIDGHDATSGFAENVDMHPASDEPHDAGIAAALPGLGETVSAMTAALEVEPEPDLSSVSAMTASAAGIFDRQHEHDRFEDYEGVGIDSELDDSSLRTGTNEWPSAQDILRWSADRHGRSFLLATSEDLKSLKMAPDRTRPRELFHMNFPTALVLCLAWLGGAAYLVSLGMSMSREDELTQRSIAAMLTAEKSGTVPRLDPQSMQRLTEAAAWWKLPPVQRWFRAVFVKLREEKGQPLAVPAERMATEVASVDPLYPPARLWKNTVPTLADMESDLTTLSIDILPLIKRADNERRRGNFPVANKVDRVALKMASEFETPLKDKEFVYDADFGMKRFLLPTQQRLLAILKRIVRDPDATRTFEAVMPEDAPIVWLTAAQLMRHAGVGDGQALADRAAKWPIPKDYTHDRRLLTELVQAEANDFLGKTDIAIETYNRLVKQIPESEWKRAVWLNLGVLNLKALKTNDAKIALKKARGENPEHEIDRYAIATIRGISELSQDSPRSATTVRAN